MQRGFRIKAGMQVCAANLRGNRLDECVVGATGLVGGWRELLRARRQVLLEGVRVGLHGRRVGCGWGDQHGRLAPAHLELQRLASSGPNCRTFQNTPCRVSKSAQTRIHVLSHAVFFIYFIHLTR